MKQYLLSFILNLFLASLAMTAWPQNLMLNQEEPEDEIAVVGYFWSYFFRLYLHLF